MRPRRARSVLTLLGPALLGAISAVVLYLAAGPTAGLFFGGFAFATLLTPALLLRSDEIVEQLLSLIGVFAGITSIWAAAVALETDLVYTQWLQCSLVFICYVIAIFGGTTFFRSFRLPPIAASALMALLGSLWLTWPIWLSPALAGHDEVVAWLTTAHPLLATDHALSSLGSPWIEHRLMYNQFSILNQDVAYPPPSTILWTCASHGLLGVIGLYATNHPSSRPMTPVN